MGVDCVAAHVNVTSEFEGEMIRQLGLISSECEEYGMPVPRQNSCCLEIKGLRSSRTA